MNSKAIHDWLSGEGPYAAFWISAVVALVCLVGAVVGLIRWFWLLFGVAGILGSLHALHIARQRDIRRAYEAEADRLMDRVQKRLQSSHPDGRVTFDDYVKALKAEGVPGAERVAAQYPRPETKGR